MTELRIALLGGLEIAGEETASAALTRKALALLAYLAMQGKRGQSREKLAGLLWGNAAEGQARANLRQTLSTIRKNFGESGSLHLVTEGDWVSLACGNLALDVARFEQLCAEQTPEALVCAIDLYKGDLLDGFSLKEEAFEAWARAERERLRHSVASALTGLIAHCEEAGDIDRCAEFAARLLNLDPLHEPAHRSLMRAYAAQGRQALALKQFASCRDILKRELGVEPEAETVALYREIRQRRAAEPGRDVVGRAIEASDDARSLPDGPSVAVLPFENKDGDPDQSYFADGITESIINGLTRFREILVIDMKSVLAARDPVGDVNEVARVLGVANIVEGSVRRAEERVRVSVRLIDMQTGRSRWAEDYDRALGEIFTVQDEITSMIVTMLAAQMEYMELHRPTKTSRKDLAAYDCWLRGRQCLNRYTQDGVLEARRHFERAIERDSAYAAAFAGLAISYLQEYEASWSNTPQNALETAYEFAQRAVALDDANNRARYALALAYFYRGQHELARVHTDKALELNPNDYHNICNKGFFLAFGDRLAESIACSREAMRLNPLAPDNCLFSIGIAEYAAGQYENALVSFGSVKGWGHHRAAWIAACYAQLGRTRQARAAAAEARQLAETTPDVPAEEDKANWRAFWSRLGQFHNPERQARFFEGLRKAGLPA